MKISFQKRQDDPALGIAFTWVMTIRADSPLNVTDHFIPELFYDYFYVKTGSVRCVDETQGTEFLLPLQALKTLYTHPLKFIFSTPLVLFGARFSLAFAETYRELNIGGDSFLERNWISEPFNDLQSFERQLVSCIGKKQIEKPTPLLSPALEESEFLRHFSTRHKRRLYKSTFGISKKEIWNIQNVHSFLEQNCDFTSEYPHIIQHVNSEVFYDQPHLNHTFKKMIGLSPLEYFEANSILQDNLMAASYNEISVEQDTI
jgi:hypothetical protein